MSADVMGFFVEPAPLPLYRGRDYQWSFVFRDPVTRQPSPIPAGAQVFLELCVDPSAPKVVWPATISGSNAVFKVESEECDKVPDRTRYQLVFMPPGEPAGGQCVKWGQVKVVTGCA